MRAEAARTTFNIELSTSNIQMKMVIGKIRP